MPSSEVPCAVDDLLVPRDRLIEKGVHREAELYTEPLTQRNFELHVT